MKQTSLDLNLSSRLTRKQVFLAQMQRVVPWAALVELTTPHYPEGKNGRPPFALETMLQVQRARGRRAGAKRGGERAAVGRLQANG